MPPEHDRLAAVHALAFGARALERSLDELTLAQFRVLSLIASSPGRASRVAERASVSRPSLTGLLDGLERRGLVRRVGVDGDRRGVGLELSDDGKAALRRAQRTTAEHLDEVLAELPPGERIAAVDGLVALGRALRVRTSAETVRG